MKKLFLRLADRLLLDSPYLFESALADALKEDARLLASVSRAVASALEASADKRVIRFDDNDM